MKITPSKYAQALAEALAAVKDPKPAINNLLEILRRKKQFKLLPKILKSFEAQWLKRHGIVKMKITYPPKFKNSLAGMAVSLERALGKKIEMEAAASDTLVGGWRVQMEDMLVDASVEGRLGVLARRMGML